MVQMNLLGKSKLLTNEPVSNLVYNILNKIGEDPEREGLINTPHRFEKALHELTSGYQMNPREVVGEGIFESEGSGLVAVDDIEFFSLCEHHMLPFW